MGETITRSSNAAHGLICSVTTGSNTTRVLLDRRRRLCLQRIGGEGTREIKVEMLLECLKSLWLLEYGEPKVGDRGLRAMSSLMGVRQRQKQAIVLTGIAT
ncbi:hypothetical protein cyc_00521 [Cyclospora cayetanensis]|uniref:Uncharacterized protein n=1 Tax=Cyclospora cayetanensis TaxID=88456 RepID=A0A1D3D8M7_9EIME|nr:hypothetical protein cyc_00521 [Cyclospora cayetanensis]